MAEGNGEWWSLWKDGEGDVEGCKQKWRLWFAPGKGDGNHSFYLGAWGRDHFCFGLNFPSWVGVLSSSLPCICLAAAWPRAWGPSLSVQTLEDKSRPLTEPQSSRLYPKGVFSAFLGSQFSQQKYSRWPYSVVSFVSLNDFFQSLRLWEGKWIAQMKIKKWNIKNISIRRNLGEFLYNVGMGKIFLPKTQILT